MEMLEYDIAGLKTRKGIQEGSQISGTGPLCLGPDPAVGSDHGNSVFQGHQERQHGRDPGLRERDGQPEKGAAPQIEGQTAAHAAAQVNIAVPEKAPFPHGPVGHDIERDLLDIIVSIVKEDALMAH